MDKETDTRNQRALETVITIRLDQNLENEDSGIGGNEVIVKDLKQENFSSVIDVKYDVEEGKLEKNLDGDFEKVCRICHLDTFESGKKWVDLIEIGCGCKGELGFVHSHCAETWFKLKGNRLCEICQEIAKNVTGISDNRFIEEWNEARFIASATGSADRDRARWRGQPFCNLLIACLIIVFLLPWFLRVSLF
ncbi:uncharacterized protein LOC132043831 [Lycium ferocissimum]|uniref:uncharacterized protein LOC132043831 n=1 Tax=Lycium ferocissimum TaxID=112874 RepID=UPI002815FD08|nr:uncharacterized protein LOC132043831 [Lycium ferocissimum]